MRNRTASAPALPNIAEPDDKILERVREVIRESDRRVRDFFDELDAPRPRTETSVHKTKGKQP